MNPGRIRRGARSSGLTLLEMLVTLVVLSAVLLVVVPGLTGLRARQQLQARAEDFWSSLMLARAQALLHQQHVSVCAVSAAGQCDPAVAWHAGWRVFVDANRNGTIDADERVLQAREAAQGVRITGNSTVRHVIGYAAGGRSESLTGAFLAGTVSLCAPGQSEGWQVVINAVGRPRLEKAPMPACP